MDVTDNHNNNNIVEAQTSLTFPSYLLFGGLGIWFTTITIERARWCRVAILNEWYLDDILYYGLGSRLHNEKGELFNRLHLCVGALHEYLVVCMLHAASTSANFMQDSFFIICSSSSSLLQSRHNVCVKSRRRKRRVDVSTVVDDDNKTQVDGLRRSRVAQQQQEALLFSKAYIYSLLSAFIHSLVDVVDWRRRTAMFA